MNSCQKIKWVILIKAGIKMPNIVDGGIIDELYEENINNLWDAKSEIRSGDFETELSCEYSRHYEAKAVCAKMPDDTYVGWTYYYGGGKHGQPDEIDWMKYAYPVTFVEKQTVVKIWSKAEEKGETK